MQAHTPIGYGYGMDFDRLQMSKKRFFLSDFFGHLQPIKIHPI